MTDSRNPSMPNGEIEIDVFALLRAFLRKLWSIILVGAIVAGATFTYTKVAVAPTYESSVKMYVNNNGISVGSASLSISSASISAAQQLVDTYIVILKSRSTLERVIEEADLRDAKGNYVSYESLNARVSAAAVDSTEIFQITVIDTDANRAMITANTIADILPYQISAIVNGSSVKIVDFAITGRQVGPSVMRNTVIGFVAGAFLVMAVVAIQTLTDLTIHDEKYLIDTYQLPLLAVVPDLSRHSGRGYYKRYGSYKKYGYTYGGKYGYKYGGKYSRYSYYAKANTKATANAEKDDVKKGENNG